MVIPAKEECSDIWPSGRPNSNRSVQICVGAEEEVISKGVNLCATFAAQVSE